jgi:ABC-type Fe3+-siderophore transport system permease subunit
MQFNLKTPIGLLFSLYGILLALYGAFGDPLQYSRSLGINVNAGWGAVLLIFGVAMLIPWKRSK